jgi:hypothetical protein
MICREKTKNSLEELLKEIKIEYKPFYETDAGKIALAEEFARICYKDQKRRDTITPYEVHPFGVRDILVKHRYTAKEYQITALLHDIYEKNDLFIHEPESKEAKFIKENLDKIFGKNIFSYISALSNVLVQRSKNGICYDPDHYIDKTKEIEKKHEIVQIVKIADIIHNSRDIQTYSPEGIIKRIYDILRKYIPIARKIAPSMATDLEDNIINYKRSEH